MELKMLGWILLAAVTALGVFSVGYYMRREKDCCKPEISCQCSFAALAVRRVKLKHNNQLTSCEKMEEARRIDQELEQLVALKGKDNKDLSLDNVTYLNSFSKSPQMISNKKGA